MDICPVSFINKVKSTAQIPEMSYHPISRIWGMMIRSNGSPCICTTKSIKVHPVKKVWGRLIDHKNALSWYQNHSTKIYSLLLPTLGSIPILEYIAATHTRTVGKIVLRVSEGLYFLWGNSPFLAYFTIYFYPSSLSHNWQETARQFTLFGSNHVVERVQNSQSSGLVLDSDIWFGSTGLNL